MMLPAHEEREEKNHRHRHSSTDNYPPGTGSLDKLQPANNKHSAARRPAQA
jgi:hypothetical protein